MLVNYIKIAFRNLSRSKVFSFINIFGLAFGINCAILIGLWLQDEVNFDKIHDNQLQLHRLLANVYWGDIATFSTLPGPLNAAMKRDFPEIKHITTLTKSEITLSINNKTIRETGFYTTPDFIQMF